MSDYKYEWECSCGAFEDDFAGEETAEESRQKHAQTCPGESEVSMYNDSYRRERFRDDDED